MKNKVNNAVICAAGVGSRLGLNIPKCLLEIGRHRLIYYLLKVLKDIPNVRIVVGYKEDEVIDYVLTIRKDVLFIRNPDYRSTSNSYSLHLGSFDLQEPFIYIDGDMYIDEENFNRFINSIDVNKNLICYTDAYTEEPVYVKINENNDLVGFSREKVSNIEWTGITYFNDIRISKEGNYVYQQLEEYLKNNTIIKTCYVKCFEIDTPNDLDYFYSNVNVNDL